MTGPTQVAQAVQFFDTVAPGESLTFQTFDDDADRKARSLAQILHGTVESCASSLHALNKRGAGVFWMVNHGDGKGRKTENVTGIRALFLDLDGAPLEPVLAAGAEPHAVVESSPGRWHVYWRVSGCSLAQFPPAQKALAAKFGGDRTVHDLPRVLRLPGFQHRKGEPFTSSIVSLEDMPPYAFDDLVQRLGLNLDKPPKPAERIDPTTGEITSKVTEGGTASNGGTVQSSEIDLQAREDAMRYPDTPANRARLLSALKALHPDADPTRDGWYMTVIRGLHSTGWHDWRELAESWATGELLGITSTEYNKKKFRQDVKGLDNNKPKAIVTVASIFALAKAAGWVDPRQTNAKATNAAPAEGVSIQCAANIEPESISWAWLYWLALRKLAVLAGQAGTGKTTIAMSCAATVSIGGTWPDGKQCPRGSVLIWSGEDDPKDTLVPRLIAAGADLSRIHFVGNASDGISTRPFDPSRDMPALQERAARIKDILLVIVDPIVAAVAGDSHKNAEVRRGLAPLVAFAETIGAALLGISHFSKGTGGRDPLERVTGSVAFGAVARVVWVTAATENEDGERMHVLARAKSNIGPDDGGFSYAFEQVDLPSHPGITASKVEWGTPLVGRARDLLAEQEEKKPAKKMETVFEWLQALLQDGPVLAKDVQAQAAAAGHAWRTVERAKPWLGVQSRRSGTGNKAPFEWHLPALDDGCEL